MYSNKKEKLPRHLFIGRAGDLKNKKDRRIYRAFEMMPGILVWTTFVLAVALSYFYPVLVSIFILLFAFFWILKTIYLSLHTRSAYKVMRQYEKRDWFKELKSLNNKEYTANVADWKDVYHLVVVPMYNESFEVVSNGFESFINSEYPKDKLIVVLGTEERAGESAQEVARKIKEKYGDKFFEFLITKHPADIPGEVAGKGSNNTWAAKQAKKEIIDKHGIDYDSIVVSSLDSDTVVPPQYFACLTYHFLTVEDPYRASYQPIPFFTNNIWQAPALSRVSAFSATFWHKLSQERPEKQTTFSSHSMTFKALLDVGFWQTNVVSEDSRIFFQCFLRYSGDYRVISLYTPVYMDANLASNGFKTMKNIYKQQRRWGYGAENIPYLLYGRLKDKSIPKDKFRKYAFVKIEGFHSWATHPIMLFLLGWLPLLLGGDEFGETLLAYNLLNMIRVFLTIAMIGLISSAFLSIILLPPKPPTHGKYKYLIMFLQWLLIPFILIFFGSLPAIDAQTRLMLGRYMGFWVTEKFRTGEEKTFVGN